jgi:hypothetical protein
MCKSCGTTYTPPTPLWAAVFFILAGALILLVDIAAVGVLIVRGGTFCFTVEVYFLLATTLAVGVRCIVYGLRCLRSQDNAPATE